MVGSIGVRTRVTLAWCWALGLLGSFHVHAASSPTVHLPLAKLIVPDTGIELRHSASEYVLYFPVADRWQVVEARLHLEFTHSISLLARRSQLRVSVNQQVVGQFPLKPDRPNAVADIAIDPATLRPGYNALHFRAAQHYTLECEDPVAPELWTRIDVQRSFVALKVRQRPVRASLAQLHKYLDRKQWPDYPLNIALAVSSPDDVALSWGALAAQNVALHLDYLPVVTHYIPVAPAAGDKAGTRRFAALDQRPFRGRDTILIGRVEQLAPLLGEDFVEPLQGASLAIFPQDHDRGHFLLIATGRSDAEVTQAIQALGIGPAPFPDQAVTRIDVYEMPPVTGLKRRDRVRFGSTYPFHELGLATTTFRGGRTSNANTGTLRFWLPADVYSTGREAVVLGLHLAFGAAMRADSVLNVFLNGQFERAIALDDVEGGVFRDYKISVPLTSFAPGYNEIRFEPRLTPLLTDYCEQGQTANLLLTLYGDSTIRFPEATRYAALPDLRRLALTGFPLLDAPQGLRIHVGGRDPETVAAAWTLTARLVQTRDMPLPAVAVGGDLDQTAQALIAVGALDKLPAALLQAAGIRSDEANQWPFPLPPEPLPERGGSPPDSDRPLSGYMVAGGGLGDFALMTEFESPFVDRATVLLVTADDAQRLNQGVRSLVEPRIWDNLQGDTVLWVDGETPVRSMRVQPRYHRGSASVPRTLSYYFSQYRPWVVGFSVLLLLGLAAGLYRAVRYFSRRHHGA